MGSSLSNIKNYNGDLFMAVTASYEPNESYIAYAGACYLDNKTGRPIIGKVHFNVAKLSTDNNDF
jgi:hypothetical protein